MKNLFAFAAAALSTRPRPFRATASCVISACLALAHATSAYPDQRSIDATTYQNLINDVFAAFSQEIAAQGARTEVVFNHNSSGIGAFTWRKNGGRIWEFHFYDGVLKIKNVTEDVLTLIVCHELGHHLAGYPFNENTSWSAAEGQADYFATHGCAPRVWAPDDNLNASFATRIPPYLKDRCDRSFVHPSRRNICYRSVNAMDAMRYYEGHNKKVLPSLSKPDPTIVKITELRHPPTQCRIDTQLAGVFCAREFDFSRIPGHLGTARNTWEAEQDSAESHCEDSQFPEYMKRPRCWFASLLPTE